MKAMIAFTAALASIGGINSAYAQKGKVLIVMSAADTLELNGGKKKRQTGVFLNELYLPFKAIVDAGYEVDFATPGGAKATIDEESKNDKYWKDHPDMKREALEFAAAHGGFNNPATLTEALKNQDEYAGMLVPGGQGLSVDLISDPKIPRLLKDFARKEKVIGLICHAPSLILTIPEKENPFVGYTFNCISPLEEFFVETFIMKGKPENRKIARRLKNHGLIYDNDWPTANYAVRDRNLVTSQNPYSSEAFNRLFLEALEDYAAKTARGN